MKAWIATLALVAGCKGGTTTPSGGSGNAKGSAPGPRTAGCDTTTDNGVRAAYHKATGKDLPDKLECVDRSSTFLGVVTIGSFASDRGCMNEGILYGCAWNDPASADAAMAKAGWPSADAATRKRLALAWLSEVDHERPLDEKPEDFDKSGKTFAPVQATPNGNGLDLTYWTLEPAGMQPESNYSLRKATFTATGREGETTTLDRATVKHHYD